MNHAPSPSPSPSPSADWPWLAHLHRLGPWLRPVFSRLPVQPPSLVLARMLTERWWPQVPLSARPGLCGRRVDVVVRDLGLTFRLSAQGQGVRMAMAQEPLAVTIQADAQAFLDLMAGREDPDTLFFERRLVMQGDTAFALLLKNTLDAVGPVTWQPWRAPRPPAPTA